MKLLKTGALVAVLAGSAELTQAAEPNAVTRGRYLAVAADCAACHTAPAGKVFAGGLPLVTPLGKIIASNITPAQAGIGGYSLADFTRALRQGVRKDGANLYPAMPYTSYAALTDADIADLYAYFTKAVAPVDVKAAPTKLPFPFNIRLSMKAWDLLFLSHSQFKSQADRSAQWNRGAYLANALEHCGVCHTPRNALMAERSTSRYAGGSLGTWYAPNITSDKASGVGAWTSGQLADYLRTGRSDNNAQAAGPMLEAVDKSLSRLEPGDIAAIVTYVRDLPAVATKTTKTSPARPALASDFDLRAAASVPAKMDGPALYDAYCASCHQAHGEGVGGAAGLPPLVGNAALGRPNADNVVMNILTGVWPENPTHQGMPAFGRMLSDDQVAKLTTYLFRQFGDSQQSISAHRVAQLRQGGAASPLLLLSRVGMAVAILVVLIGGLLLMRRRSLRRASTHAGRAAV